MSYPRVRLAVGLLPLVFVTAAPVAAQAPSADIRSLAAGCYTCHGTEGRSAGGVPPALAGRDKGELIRQMQDFKTGKRPATLMHQLAKGYTEEQIERIAAYFSAVAPAAPAAPARAAY